MSPPSSYKAKKPRSGQDTLQVIQTNLQKSKLGQQEVSRRISIFNKNNIPFLYFVQEPMIINSRPTWQPSSCKRFGFASKPRTLIYTDMNSKAWYIESLSSSDITVIQTVINGKSTLLLSVYLDINWIQVIPKELHKVMKYAEDKGLGILIAADTNCHSSLFGPSTNKRGEQLELFIAKYKLHIENNSHIPTYESRGAATCIDITLTARMGVSVQKWEVNRGFNGSDHNSIEFELMTDKITLEPQWIWSQANWEMFSIEIKNNLITQSKYAITQRECDNMVNALYNTISKALDKAVPKSKKRIVDKNNPWWNTYLAKQRRKLDTLYKHQKSNKGNCAKEKYKAFRKEYKKDIELSLIHI